MTLLVLILVNPRKAFSRIRSSSPWGIALLAVILAGGILIALEQSRVVEATLSHLPRSADEADRNALRGYLSQDLVSRLILFPIRLGGGIAAFAFVLQLLCKSFQPHSRMPFRTVFSLLVHAECVYILALAAGWIGSMITSGQVAELRMPLSLASVAGDRVDFPLRALLNSLNIFTLWYLTLVGAGVVSLLDMNRWKAAAAVIIVWALSQLISLASLSFVRDSLRLLL